MTLDNLLTTNNLGTEFELGVIPNKITLKLASDTVAGKVALATVGNYPQNINDVDATTPAFVKAAIDSAIQLAAPKTPRKEIYQSLTSGSVITLQYTPASTVTLFVYRNGDLINDYSLVGNTLTFNTAFGNSTGGFGAEEAVIFYES